MFNSDILGIEYNKYISVDQLIKFKNEIEENLELFESIKWNGKIYQLKSVKDDHIMVIDRYGDYGEFKLKTE